MESFDALCVRGLGLHASHATNTQLEGRGRQAGRTAQHGDMLRNQQSIEWPAYGLLRQAPRLTRRVKVLVTHLQLDLGAGVGGYGLGVRVGDSCVGLADLNAFISASHALTEASSTFAGPLIWTCTLPPNSNAA